MKKERVKLKYSQSATKLSKEYHPHFHRKTVSQNNHRTEFPIRRISLSKVQLAYESYINTPRGVKV